MIFNKFSRILLNYSHILKSTTWNEISDGICFFVELFSVYFSWMLVIQVSIRHIICEMNTLQVIHPIFPFRFLAYKESQFNRLFNVI